MTRKDLAEGGITVKQKTETATVVIGMLTMLGLGMFISSDTNIYNVKGGDDFTYQHVNYTGTLERGGYEFRFLENIEKPEKYKNTSFVINGEALVGNRQRIVKIRTGRPAGEIMDTCRHEVLHHYFPGYRHPDFTKPGVYIRDDPIYRLEDKVELPVCDQVVANALTYQR